MKQLLSLRYQVSSIRCHVSGIKTASGQSLIEVVIALSAVVALSLSLVSTSLVTQRTSRSARLNTQATKLVEQSIEQVRVFRDRKPGGLAAFPAENPCYKLDTSAPDPLNWFFGGVCPEIITFDKVALSRSIQISNVSTTKKLITVTVSWTDSGGTQSVKNQTYLTSWCSGTISGGSSPCPTP